MTAIRCLVFALLCTLTVSLSYQGASATDNGLSNLFSSLSGTWTCQAQKGDAVADITLDDTFHAELLSMPMESTQDHQSPSQLSLVASRFWDSLWTGEQVFYEFVSETAFRLVLAVENAENSSLTCTQQNQTTDI